jgi:hypothetical protein
MKVYQDGGSYFFNQRKVHQELMDQYASTLVISSVVSSASILYLVRMVLQKIEETTSPPSVKT